MKLKRLLQEQITNTQAQVNTYTKDSVDNNLDGAVDGADMDRSIAFMVRNKYWPMNGCSKAVDAS
jgi:hypothetical protein